ncbi:MAG: ATP-binding protein [Desulfovibrionaceae bacterium]
MAHWLPPSVIACLVTSGILCLVHYFLYRQYAKRFLFQWTLSWLLYTLRFAFQLLLITRGDNDFLQIASQFFSVGSAFFLLWGVLEFADKRLSRFWPVATLLTLGWVAASISLDAPFLVIALPTFLFLGYAQIITGVTLLRIPNTRSFAGRLAGFSLIAWGVHKLDYPLLRTTEWFAPWGFLLGAALGLLTAIAILLMYFERMHQALSRNERLHRCLAENYPNGAVYLFDADLRYILADGTVFPESEQTKYTVEGRTVDQVFPGENLPNLRAAYHEALAGRSAVLELSFGDRIRETRTLPIRNEAGDVIWGMSISHDVTDRLRTEEALRESEERYRNIFDNILDGYFRIGMEGRLQLFNHSAQRMLGHDAPEALRNAAVAPTFITQQDWDAFRQQILREGAVEGFHVPVRRKDGTIFDAEANARCITDRHTGEVVAVEGVIRDISERKHSERELQRAKEVAEHANLVKSQFLANMSHEVRTPLNGVLGMLQLLGGTPLDATQHHFVELALSSGRGLLALLDDVLNLSKIESGSSKMVTTSFSPADVAETVVRLFQPEADAKGLNLSLSIAPQARGQMLGDEGRLRQILFNLLGNAIKFTERGGVAMELSALPVPPPQGGTRLLFIVADTGIGIAPDNIDHVFEPFAQADGSYTRVHQGAGLGLSIVKRLVALLGGSMTVDSDLDQGTAMYVSLPFGQARPASASLDPPHQPIQDAPGRRILLAEDDPVNAVAAMRMLEAMGHSVTLATSGKEAIETLARNTFDLVIMDIQMPVMDGMAATNAIRHAPGGMFDTSIPIIAMTAHAMQGDRETFLDAGMDGYIAKPVDMKALESVIRDVMVGHSGQVR